MILLITMPLIIKLITERDIRKNNLTSENVELSEPPPIDKAQPPPPLVVPPPPIRETIKFTPPKVVKNEEVNNEPPPAQEEMEQKTVSTVTQEGSKIIDLPPEKIISPEADEDKIFTTVSEMPSFPNGTEKYFEFVRNNIRYPIEARENGIYGKVYVSFTTDKNGKIKDVKLVRGIGGGCNEEAIRIVKAMPDWIPGRQNGQKVSVANITVVIDFVLK
jgi:protein TonB